MVIIIGTILAMVLAIVLASFIGPSGAFVIVAILFGIVLSMHQRNLQIYKDIQRIKEKLGIEDHDDFNLKNEDIEHELEEELLRDDESTIMKE